MRGYRLLKANEIECRIQEIDRQGRFLRLLLYKTVRTDAAILDETHGPMNWQNDYKSIDGKLYCGIGVHSGTEWIWKWNTGTESNMEAQKGEASDAMKRSGFCWGIGTELYSAPLITIWTPKADIKTNNNGKYVCYDRFSVRDIGYDQNEDICKLVIVNESTGMDVFAWSAGQKAAPAPKATEEPKEPEERCERCARAILPYKNPKGQTVTVAQHIAASKKKCNGMQLCLDCATEYFELKKNAAVGQ